jgi:hypothetical protein
MNMFQKSIANVELSYVETIIQLKDGVNFTARKCVGSGKIIYEYRYKKISFTHGAEPLLSSCQLCSHSRTSKRFMEPEGSLPRSQDLSTGPYPEPHRSNPYHLILSL